MSKNIDEPVIDDNPPLAINFFSPQWNWQPPSRYQRITSIDTHTGGEPLRIIVSGLPPIHGTTVVEKRRYFMQHYDRLRRGLLLEPRGHADMYGAILTTPSKPNEADLDVFFINTHGYSPMCGHAILAIAKVAFETRLIGKEGQETREIRMSSPAGMVYARATFDTETGDVAQTSFRNVPSFVYQQNQTVTVPGLGDLIFDISFGGAFYAIVPVEVLPISDQMDIMPENCGAFISLGRKIRRAILSDPRIEIQHPVEPDLSDLFGVIFTSIPHDTKNHSRNVNVFEDGEVDRSATGTGVSARAALHFARGEIGVGQTFTVESIVGSTMTGKVVEEVQFGGFKAVVPEVGGVAHIMSQSELLFDPDDPFYSGFLLR